MKRIVIASGGLGNQMFEYAFILALRHLGYNVAIDLNLYDITKQHNGWELDHVFDIKDGIRYSTVPRLLTRLLCHFRKNHLTLVETTPMLYDRRMLQPTKPFLKGVWINPRYFENIDQTIREAFSFKNIDDKNVDMAKEMKNVCSVALHVRRGDYLNLESYNVCDEDYYTTAIRKILEKHHNPVFYIFSNDPDWCRNWISKFNVDYVIIDHNHGKGSYRDMFLMTQCKHFIIANSTFSWWGAWLSSNKEKTVICPKRWFKDYDYTPNMDSWITI